MSVILVQNLGKAYKNYPTRWSRLLEWIRPGHKKYHTLQWVMQDISFSVAAGESVGIIGVNGAGKSTLLKMVTGTTQPTTGQITMSGRVAALLELGMGFHPDFTGRQNAYMAAQLQGLTAQYVDQLMPDIEAFAEIGDYIDLPVRTYSSGMQMRLAFSVATAVRPDILIVDEALSVGDAYFQHKSFERIREFSKQGTSLLIVSHDKQAIQSICTRAILLNGGKIEREGDPESVMDYYNALLADKQNQKLVQTQIDDGRMQTISGTGEAEVVEVGLFDESGSPLEYITVGQRVVLKIKAKIKKNIPRLVFGFGIKDRLGQVVFGTNTDLTNQAACNLLAQQEVLFTSSFDANFGVGSYSVQTALVSTDTHLVNNYEWRDLALVFHVINTNKPHFAGMLWLETRTEVDLV